MALCWDLYFVHSDCLPLSSGSERKLFAVSLYPFIIPLFIAFISL